MSGPTRADHSPGGDPPRIAVAVPAYDAADHLCETLAAILGQTLRPAEVQVAVDAACNDATLHAARSFEPDVTVLEHPPTGSMRARQLAVEATSSPLVAPCDADDIWMPAKLERQAEVLAARPDLDGVFCAVTEFGSGDGVTRIRRAHDRIDGRVASALLVRRARLDAVGGFTAGDHLAQWIEWLSVAIDRGLRTGVVDDVLVRRRMRVDGYTSRHRDDTGALLSTMRDHIARRRCAQRSVDGT